MLIRPTPKYKSGQAFIITETLLLVMSARFTSIGEGRTISLLFILKDGPLILKEMKSVIPNAQTLRQRLDQMRRERLVRISVVKDVHKQVRAELTDLGLEVAEMFSDVDRSLLPDKRFEDKSIDMRHFDNVIRMLHDKNYVVQKELRDAIGTFDTVIRVLKAMESDGIVDRVDNREGGREIRYSLTPIGRKIADVYQSIYKKISSNGIL